MVFALIGNQNCGKTTLFNRLTGSNQHTGNFPGVTVDKKEGYMKKDKNLTEAYMALNPDVTVEVQQSDSTTGMTSTIDGAYDIGMASRELKDSELEAGLTPTVIAQDGIAVIVNKENTLTGLTSEQVLSIYTGETTDWSELP